MDFAIGAALALVVTTVWAALLRRYPPSWRPQWGRLPYVTIALTLAFALALRFYGREATLWGAGMLLLVLAVVLTRRSEQARAIERAIASLRDAPAREAARAELVARVGRAPRGRRYAVWAQMVQHVAAGAARAGLPEEALRWAERLDVERLEPLTVAARAQVMAVAYIALHDRARAREILASVPRPVRAPTWERALSSIEVLLEALEGDAAAAEKRARTGLEAETVPALRWTWRTAHAHALAALERRDEALQELRELRADDVAVLERVARHGGPASPLAESLLVDGGTAYRR